jgi:hypothetical protein
MRRFNGTAGAASILPRFDSQTVTVRSRSMVKDDGTRLRLSVAVWGYVQAHSVARQKLAGWNGLCLGTEKAQSQSPALDEWAPRSLQVQSSKSRTRAAVAN